MKPKHEEDRMAEVNSVRGSGNIKSASKGDVRIKDVDRSATTDLGQIDIEGRIYKPSVFYVLARGSVNYQGIQLHQDFTNRIVQSALKRPF